MHLFNQKYSEFVFYIIKIPKKQFSILTSFQM